MKVSDTCKEWKFIFTERKQHFLNVEPCDTFVTSFFYWNNTGRLQYIDTVKTSCGCTEVEYPRKLIRNNEKGKITIAIDVSGTYGYFSKSVAVYFHNQKPVVLKVMGKIRKDQKQRNDTTYTTGK